jgi:stage II sporulation protein GA (sporulation sigma-E factor processing peptidase)
MLTFVAEVEVQVGEYTSRCAGLIDTGNQLYEPLTRTPVMVMEAAQWEGKLPDDWIAKIRAGRSEDLLLSESASGDWQDRLRLVPYRGVNKSTQLMVALKPDRVVVTQGESRTETIRTLVGLDGGTLSRDGTYHAIIHPALLAEE